MKLKYKTYYIIDYEYVVYRETLKSFHLLASPVTIGAESRTCTYNNGCDPLTFTASVISAYPLFDVILGTAVSLATLLLMTKLPKVARKNGRPLK